MPRAKSKTKPKTVTSHGLLGALPVDPKTLMPDISLRMMQPGVPDYDPDKDSMIVGFVLGSKMVPHHLKDHKELVKADDVTPYYFLTDPITGLRPGETKKPWSAATINLQKEISEYHALPPVAIWKAGAWLIDVMDDEDFQLGALPKTTQDEIEAAAVDWPVAGLPAKLRNLYVVSGEGTPGNNVYRVYVCPDKIGSIIDRVPHPLMWKKNEFESWQSWGAGSKTTPVTTPAASTSKKVTIPAGVRVRCDCGHWFKMDELTGHSQVCVTKTGETEAAWAIMCAAECGCRTLDEASKPKEGFPRPKTEPVAAEPTEPQETPQEVPA